MTTNPIDLLFTAYHRQVLGLLLPRPEVGLLGAAELLDPEAR